MPDFVVVYGIVGILLLLILLATYNSLMHMRQEVRSAWAQMDEQLKNRYGLISELVNLMQNAGGAAAEKLSAVTAARNRAAVAFNPVDLASAESDLSIGVQRLLETGDQQENLNKDPRYITLRQKLQRSEIQIAQSSKRYNEQVDALNASMCSFPCMFAAKLVGLHRQPMFGL